MQLGLDLNVSMRLEQKLSPQMIQSLKLLQVTALELEAMVVQELETNPLLERAEDQEESADSLDTSASEPVEPMSEDITASNADGSDVVPDNASTEETFKDLDQVGQKKDEVDWDAFFEDGFDAGYRSTEEKPDPDMARMERLPVALRSLQDILLAQLQFHRISARARPLVEYLINSLDDDGYLRLSLAELDEHEENEEIRQIHEVAEYKIEENQVSTAVREAFHVLRKLDPPGLGARNLRECLLLQMDRKGMESPLLRRIVEEAFSDLEKLKIAALARRFEVEPDVMQGIIHEIGKLEPKPGRLISQDAAPTIIPDLVVETIDNEMVIYFNEKYIPSLKVSNKYQSALGKDSRVPTSEKKFIREKLSSATWLIRAIEQRKSTMMKVMHAIVESQPEFFSEGPAHLKPLILQNIADKIGMHISTVSRVINGKYVQTSHGVFELKYFFTSAVTQEDGEDVSSAKFKDAIRNLVEAEDAHHPLSDQKISDMLRKENLEVARRTVAKYRDQLSILPARLRKKF